MATVNFNTPTHLLTDLISTQRLTSTRSTAGGESRSYAASLTNIAARVQPMSGSEVVRYGRDNTRNMVRVYTGDQDIVPTDRISFGGKYYDIIEVSNLQSADVLLRIICEQTEP